jgi:ribosomal 30S subunit maturation factor RimM
MDVGKGQDLKVLVGEELVVSSELAQGEFYVEDIIKYTVEEAAKQYRIKHEK